MAETLKSLPNRHKEPPRSSNIRNGMQISGMHPQSPWLAHLRQPPNRPLQSSYPSKPILPHENQGRNQEFSKSHHPNRFCHPLAHSASRSHVLCVPQPCVLRASRQQPHRYPQIRRQYLPNFRIWHANVPRGAQKGGICMPLCASTGRRSCAWGTPLELPLPPHSSLKHQTLSDGSRHQNGRGARTLI